MECMGRCLVLLCLLAVSGGALGVENIGTGKGLTYTVGASAGAAAVLPPTAAIGTKLYASVSGKAGQKYAGDVYGQGNVTLTLVIETQIKLEVAVWNMTGQMPPFFQFIRIGSGNYTNRIVLSTSSGTWTQRRQPYKGMKVLQMSVNINDSDIFGRIPGWTLHQIFSFLAEAPDSFFVNICTVSYVSGAVRGNFTNV